ncbi:MAG: hypothetical protein IMZ61_03805 [Planctomycetes bacterium]|nr:hypothetical protein [Planctomycetota bacterium]
MKKVLLLIVCLAFVSVAIAEEKPVNLLKSLQRSSWEIGPDAYYFQYKESGMKETGYFYGVQAAYTYREWAPMFPTDDAELKWMFRAEGRYDWGVVDYDGELMDGTPYTYDNIRDRTGEFRLLFGPDFPKATAVDTIYSGLGYRFLDDSKSGDPAGYDRQSVYVYLPVGFKTLRNFAGNWLISANAEFDLLLVGNQSSNLGGTTLHNRQNSGYGLRGSVGFEYNTKETDISIQPFVRYWNIADSQVDSGFIEPKNNTTEIGLDFIFRF